MTPESQRENVQRAAAAIARLVAAGHQVTVSHGNGPQIGLLASDTETDAQSKVDAVCRFAMQTGGIAETGRLDDAADSLGGRAGTLVPR